MKSKILNDRYTRNSGRSPKGFGSWAFHPNWNADVLSSQPPVLWVNQARYGEAKKVAAIHFGSLGFETVETLP